jgi:uncharacterized protein (TIGR02588 family)
LLAIVGFLLYESLQPSTLPSVTVATEGITSAGDGYLVEIQATNTGESTAATVEIEGTLMPADDPNADPVETCTVSFDYIPSKATRRGGLFFVQDPAQYLLEVRALGYAKP